MIASGNTAVVLLSEQDPLPSLEWSELLSTSDLPRNVIELLSGHKSELVLHLARHIDVNALSPNGLDLTPTESALQDATVNVKDTLYAPTLDYSADPVRSLDVVRLFVETKTMSQQVGW